MRLGSPAGVCMAKIRAGRGVRRQGKLQIMCGFSAGDENRETMGAETRLGPCIECL